MGGVCGCSIAPISNCYNIGTVTATSSGADISGICGYYFGPIKNCYYLADTEDENGGKTTAQFASGEVAYLLSQGCTVVVDNSDVTYDGSIWGQNLATDKTPVLGGQKVYKVEKTGCGIETSEEVYSNTNENIVVEHSFENGICTKCGTKEEAKQNSNGYYEISNAGQLYWFAAKVNASEKSANAILTADIVVNEGDLSGYDGISKNSWRKWTPIKSYSGTFDGQNHKISGLYFNDDNEQFIGLFGITEGATIKKVGVVNSYFKGSENVGGICGVGSGGTISECYSTATVIGINVAGGICGIFDSLNVINCFNSGKISARSEVGGICGSIRNSSVENCYYDKTVFTGDAIGNTSDTNTIEKVEGKTTEQFASGEVAMLLGDAFGQTIGTDEIPVLGGQKVYNVKKYSDCGKTTEVGSVYSNSEEDIAPAHNYSNGGICNVCNGLENGKDGFKSASVSLTDGVIVNYNVILSKEAIEDENAHINFKSESGINKNIKFSEAVLTGETYKFSLELRPDQMSETITAQVIYGDGTNGSSVDFSIKEYSENLPNEKDKKLADSMKLYGAFAQAYTGRKTDNLVSDIKDYETNATIGEEYNYSLTENASGIKAKSATLQIGSQVTIVVKYQLEEGKNISDYDFMCGDKSLEPVKNGNYYCVYLKNILPQDLDKMYEFVVKDSAGNETTLKYSAFSYMKSAFEKADSDKKLTNLLNSMYDYNKAAEDHMKG